MSIRKEETTRKLVGMLIQILHGEYSDTRDLAVVQLVLLGEEAVPYICAYLQEEGELEKDLINFYTVYEKLESQVHVRGSFVERDPEYDQTLETTEQLEKTFKEKWGHVPSYYTGYEGGDHGKAGPGLPESREHAVDGALRALGIIGDDRALPTLQSLPQQKLPVSNICGLGKRPLFEKMNETKELIQHR